MASPYPYLSEKRATNRGDDALGNALLPQSALCLRRPAVWPGCAGAGWLQPGTHTGVVSGLGPEDGVDGRHRRLRARHCSTTLRTRGAGTGRGSCPPRHSTHGPTRQRDGLRVVASRRPSVSIGHGVAREEPPRDGMPRGCTLEGRPYHRASPAHGPAAVRE